ncbi:MAG: ADOP family duplicated permease, partial [Gemmatimonadales bacterium]
PALGRGFTAADAEPGAPGTVILSDPFWRARFAADPGVLGRVIHLDGGAYEVIGVLSPALRFPRPSTQFWIPLLLPEEVYLDRGNNYLEVVATLRPGTTIEAARADLDVVTRRLAALYPDANRDTGATVERLRDQITERSRLLLLALVGASLCILIIACANLGSLLIARGLARERELAVRAALGAGRERLVRQLVTESLVLAGGGGVLGVLVAGFSLPLLSRLVPPSLPLPGAPSIDLRVIGFAALLTVLTCLLFTVLPARRASSGLRFAVLRDGRTAGRSSRLRAALVAVEIAASVVLLVSAGLLMRAIQRVQAVDPGFRTENLLTVRTPLASPAYDSTNRRVAFYRRVVDEVRALPGVIHAAYVTSVPLLWGGGIWPVVVNGEAEIRAAANSASMRFVTPGYFGAMDIPLRQGRDVAQQDRLESPSVAVVSQSFVDRYWPGEPALGKRFRMAFAEREIVGVVADIRVRGLERGNEPQVYMPAAQIPGGGLPFYWPRDLVIHTEAGAMPSLAELERIVHAVDGDVPLASFQTMAEIVGDQTASRSVQLRVLGALAAVALLLAVVGIHGLLAFMVAERTPEIGVRIALGAGSRSVVSMVVGRALALAAVGLVPGVWVAYLAGRSMESALFGVTASDRLTFALVIVLCLAAALFGALAPALRAVRVDPIRALKSD